ncbi:phasin family protein [Mesorhizobium marinum]|uniref:phasin family protein n=1 Tax=Mesorhizobium marinum TaxID=3228790 RepID=UPI0034673B03
MTRSFDDAGTFGKRFLDTSLDSLNSVSQGTQAIGAEASDYAARAIEAGSETVARLMAATSVETAAQIQADYLTQAYRGFVSGATRLGGLYADMARDAYRPFESIVVRTK